MSDLRTHPPSLPPEVERLAEAEAERFYGDGPAAAWQPAPQWTWPTRAIKRALWVALALLAVAAITTAAVMRAWPSADDENAIDLRVANDPAQDVIDEPVPAAAPPPPSTATAPHPVVPGTLFNVTRLGREWRIDAMGASRLMAAQRLAQASGSLLLGDVAILAEARPLDLQWQGRDVAGAWRAVLGSEVSFATHCASPSRCRVWVLGAHDGSGSAHVLAAPARTPIPLPVSGEVALAPPASDSPDPRVAAHHD